MSHLPSVAAVVVLVIASLALITVQQRNRAVRRAEDLRQLVGTVTSEINTLLTDLPKSTAVRQKLVLASVKYLDRLSSETTDPVLLSELAEGYSQLAEVTGTQSEARSMGDLPAAVDLHERAQALIERSSRDEPNNLVIRERHVSVLLMRAPIQPLAEAQGTVRLAERLFESVV